MNQPGSIFYLDNKVGRTVSVDSHEYLFFSGYNYLGINQQIEFTELVKEGISRFGWLFPSSRISNTRLFLYEECEAMLSGITGSEDTVLLPSGFAAGQLATSRHIQNLHNAPGSHPAIARNSSVHQDFKTWSDWLLREANQSYPGDTLALASNSLDPLSGTLHDFSFIKDIEQCLAIIIDDSHGVGIIGKDGSGISSLLPLGRKDSYTFTYSLSKAFGVPGGAISCNKEDADQLRKLPGYSAVSPLSPGMIYAFIKGQQIYARQRQKLLENIHYFASLTKDLTGLKYDSRFPVFVLPADLNEQTFERNNIIISSFAYPDQEGPRIKRLVLNALHTDDDLRTLADVLKQAYNQTP